MLGLTNYELSLKVISSTASDTLFTAADRHCRSRGRKDDFTNYLELTQLI